MSATFSASLSHLKLRHLLLVQFLLAHGTLHKAARLLSISQPAATGMLNDLERMLGLQLFARSRTGMTPTAATLRLVDKMRTLTHEFSDFAAAVERTAQGQELVLRVGVVPQAFIAHMPQAIERFRAAGGCALHAQEGTARQLLESLQAGELDAVVGRLPADGLPPGLTAADLSILPLYREEVCLVARPDHPILQVKRLTLKRLAQAQWVLQRPDSSVRRALADAFLREGLLPPQPAVETPTYIQNLAVVAGSQLLTVAPRRAAEQQAALGQVALLDFRLGIAPMEVSLLVRRNTQHNAMLARFKTALQESISGQAPARKGDRGTGRTVRSVRH